MITLSENYRKEYVKTANELVYYLTEVYMYISCLALVLLLMNSVICFCKTTGIEFVFWCFFLQGDRYVRSPKIYESYLYYEKTLKSIYELVDMLT